ncbi:UDP-N-acetylglucosamine 2-epimerase [Halogeometricum borinquense DSM 11551]|uniref:UDP-N-acetylglucosamine 2-epimerase n=2 Tax=Halogeometricum borinquense TaxID=60847 RepID=E4NWE6_HALBP|nr:UDP-N-acetylglucosamine 2-epimerase (non-hydrolyzing) [Halogeometricum borinquense]ADQ69366.1 UDP-N-acetylglucosamine 2-epimerase [Halogeometricum borinquense DSM 11551]ELY26254.1 UDP-N-acetylglucosamine 2-epimerase [Halogeometricum borinquense DSM 11551]RYJ19588.1 UDP-N-acetylglucosamine 2-epimerase (non-hydrolyzing) [Halogeometricum borinquense]
MTATSDGTPKVAIILGTRPEIIKCAPLIKACDRRGVDCLLIHTGQHYSEDLDQVFFDQLELPTPDYNLEVGSRSHGEQTGRMLEGIENLLEAHTPDIVLVQGDTNSVLAGALAGAKSNIDVGHVEAGLRSFDREMPEETNRVVTDHVSDYLFAPTEETKRYLERESVPGEIVVTGNTIVDSLYEYRDLAAEKSDVLNELNVAEDDFYLLTAHRAENVDTRDSFDRLLEGVSRFAAQTDREVVYPIHPRAQSRLDEFGLAVPEEIRTIEPLDFLDFLRLESAAALVFTDSGGVQEETCILGTPCVTLRYSTERPETAYVGANCLAGLDPDDIVEAGTMMLGKCADWDVPFGDGRAAERILDVLAVGAEPDAAEVPT